MGDEMLWTSTELAKRLGVDARTIATWRSRHVGPPFLRLSRRCIRYSPRSVSEWLQRRGVDRDRDSAGPDDGERIVVQLVDGLQPGRRR